MRIARTASALAFACVATTAIAHCATVTELVVVVDTDLEPGSEVDAIDVEIDDNAGFETHKSAGIFGPESLPLFGRHALTAIP